MNGMPPDDIESELAGLADGSSTPEQQAQALLRVESSPELARELAEQQRALAMTRSAQAVQAPPSLHAAVERLVAEAERGHAGETEHVRADEANRGRAGEQGHAGRRRPASRWRVQRRQLGLTGISLAIAAVVAIALALAPSGGGPTLADAVTFTQLPAALRAPQESASGDGRLRASIAGVSFPYWEQRYGWRATGQRAGTVGGRAAKAVYYTNAHGRRVGYAIVSGGALPARGGRVVWRRRIPYRLLSVNGVSTVTWLRDGHTCVLTGHKVRPSMLLKLASGRRARA